MSQRIHGLLGPRKTHKRKGVFSGNGVRHPRLISDAFRAGLFDDPGSGEYSLMRHSFMCLFGALGCGHSRVPAFRSQTNLGRGSTVALWRPATLSTGNPPRTRYMYSLCCAIQLQGRRSGFRAGFHPHSSRESLGSAFRPAEGRPEERF